MRCDGSVPRLRPPQVCGICIATVGDLGRSLGKKILPFCDEILTILYQLVNDANVNRKLKPGIIQCFGDIALATEGSFERYLPHVVQARLMSTDRAAECDASMLQVFQVGFRRCSRWCLRVFQAVFKRGASGEGV